MPRHADITKQFLGVTLDKDLVEQIKTAAEIQASQRHSAPKVSAYLNELLHKVMPGELERLNEEIKR